MKRSGYRRITKINEFVNLEEKREFLKRTFKILENKIGRHEIEEEINLSLATLDQIRPHYEELRIKTSTYMLECKITLPNFHIISPPQSMWWIKSYPHCFNLCGSNIAI